MKHIAIFTFLISLIGSLALAAPKPQHEKPQDETIAKISLENKGGSFSVIRAGQEHFVVKTEADGSTKRKRVDESLAKTLKGSLVDTVWEIHYKGKVTRTCTAAAELIAPESLDYARVCVENTPAYSRLREMTRKLEDIVG